MPRPAISFIASRALQQQQHARLCISELVGNKCNLVIHQPHQKPSCSNLSPAGSWSINEQYQERLLCKQATQCREMSMHARCSAGRLTTPRRKHSRVYLLASLACYSAGVHEAAPGVDVRPDAQSAHVGHDSPHLPNVPLPSPGFGQHVA